MIPRTLAAGLLAAILAASAMAVEPGVKHATRPEKFRLSYEKVGFNATDSVSLSGWWFPGPPGAIAVVLASGGRGTMADLLPWVVEFHRRGLSVLTFDYRDFGPQGPGPQDSLRYLVHASRWVNDMVGAIRYARTRVDSGGRVFAWGGQDLGSAVALAAAARDRRLCSGVAFEGLFINSEQVMRSNGTAVIPEAVAAQRLAIQPRDEPYAASALVRVPVLEILAGRDTVTPPKVTAGLVVRSRTRHDRLEFPEAGHEGLERQPGYFDRVCAWFRDMTELERSR